MTIPHAQRVAEFGSFDWTWTGSVANPEAVTVDRAWSRANIVRTRLPGMDQDVWLHKEAVRPFQLWLIACHENGLRDNLNVCAGAWVPRFIRQNGTLHERIEKCRQLAASHNGAKLSNHSWGTAIDFDAGKYPLGKACPTSDPRWEVAELASSFGIQWGGRYQLRPDAMHFELARRWHINPDA